MSKTVLAPSGRVYPAPVVIVSCGNEASSNLITCAWAGTVNLEPPTAYVSVRRDRFSHHFIKESGEFVINLVTKETLEAADICGIVSGRDCDKWEKASLHKEKAAAVSVPLVKESLLSLECRVVNTVSLGTHDMFIGQIAAVDADDSLLDEKGRLSPEAAGFIAMAGGSYLGTAEQVKKVGFTHKK